jgi:hypothetical protein
MKTMIRRAMLGLAAFALATPATAAWRRAESPNFVVYSNGSEQDLRERILLLEDFDHLLRLLTSVNEPPAPNRLRITFVNNHRELTMLSPVGTGIVGFYTADADGVGAFIDRSVQSGEREQAGNNETLFHEYAHHFMMQYRPNAYPAWYVEGFAEYFSTVRIRAGTIDIGNFSQGRAYSISEGNWLPMEQILSVRPQNLAPQAMDMFYAQSWLTVHYFYSTPERQAALGRFLVAARTVTPAAALESATGFTPQRFTQELRSYIGAGQIRYRRMRRASAETPPPVTVTPLPASADDLMIYDAALHIGIADSNRAPYLERIRAIAARTPDDPYAMRVQAQAEALYGDGAVADRLLDRLLATTPHDAELMYLKGMRHLRAAEQADAPEGEALAARQWFTRAHREDENHFQTLYRFAESLRGDPSYVSENTSNVLLLAHQLAPQVAEISLNAAAMLMNRGQFADAVALLRPLAADPHNAGLARAARQMLEQAEAARRPGETPASASAPAAAKPEGH